MRGDRPDNNAERNDASATPDSPLERAASRKQIPRGLALRRQEASAAAQARDRESVPSPLPNRASATARRIEQRLTVISPRRVAPEPNRAQYFVLPQAGAAKKRGYGGIISFAICVVLPVLVATIYFCFFASDQYVAEFRFSVQDTSSNSVSVPSGLQSVLGTTPASSSNNNYLVADFLTSRETVEELQKRIDVTRLYSKSGIDWWARFDASKPIEQFLPYWQSMVTANYDQVTGLATATVRAFSPNDALLIANTMVKLSEELINQIANRSQRDAVRFAETEVEKAQARLKEQRAKLTDYRNRVGVIDPTSSVAASNSSLVQTQRANLAQLETQLATYMKQNLAPNAPVIVTLKNQIKATKDQLAATEADVGKGVNGAALSQVVGEYEQLNLEVQFAQNMVTSTMAALDTARANAASQHLYITPYVRPSLPQSATYPKRLLSISAVAALAFALWTIMLLIVRSIRERFS